MRRLLACVTAAFFACSPFGSGGTADPTEETPTNDAGKKKDSGGTPSVVDASPPAEANVDISPIPPANAFADVTYGRIDHFDDRFDSPRGGPFGWQVGVSGEGKPDDLIRFANCTAAPACGGQVAKLQNSGKDGGGFLEANLSPTTKQLRFDFALHVEKSEPADQGALQLASIKLAGGRFIIVAVDGSTLQLIDQTSQTDPGNAVQLDTLSYGVWSRYRLFVDLENRSFRLWRDGADLGHKDLREEVAAAAPETVRIGITYVIGNQFFTSFDDVGVREW